MKFEVSLDSMEKSQQFIADFCKSNEFNSGIISKASVCCDEIFSNIVRYSGASFSEITISKESDGALKMEFIDDGKPFNPLKDADIPDITASVQERKIGGLGIFMVKRMSRSIEYSRSENINKLILKI